MPLSEAIPTDENIRLDKHDFLIMLAITLVYLLVALYDLGSFKVPATTWQPLKPGSSFDVDFGREINVGRIYYYSGINESRYDQARFFILYRKGDAYYPLTEIDKKECGIWRFKEVAAKTSRLKIVANPPGGALNELVFVEKGGRTPFRNIRVVYSEAATTGSDPGRLFDEPEAFEYAPSFRSGFYFDEIYHVRTAYEYLHSMEPYETTHPPLGKLLIASGIAVFGMNSIGWRIPGTLFGAAMLPIMYLFARKLFGGHFLPFCASFLVMVDFMHFTHTRMAVIDVYPTVFVMLMFYFLYDFYMHTTVETRMIPLFLSGLCFGLGQLPVDQSLRRGRPRLPGSSTPLPQPPAGIRYAARLPCTGVSFPAVFFCDSSSTVPGLVSPIRHSQGLWGTA